MGNFLALLLGFLDRTHYAESCWCSRGIIVHFVRWNLTSHLRSCLGKPRCARAVCPLQSCGQVLDSAWAVILDLLHAVAQGATDAPPPALRRRASDGESGEGVALEAEGEEGEEEFVDDARNSGTAVAWGGACLSLAFKCLQIIVDDFLERLPREQVRAVCSRFLRR